jgi:hypothetical protein
MSAFGIVARCGLVVTLIACVPSVGARDWVFRIIDGQFDIENDQRTASINDAGVTVFDAGPWADQPTASARKCSLTRRANSIACGGR